MKSKHNKREYYLMALFLHFPVKLYSNYDLREEFESSFSEDDTLNLYRTEFNILIKKILENSQIKEVNKDKLIESRYKEYIKSIHNLDLPKNKDEYNFLIDDLQLNKFQSIDILENISRGAKKINCCEDHASLGKRYAKNYKRRVGEKYRIE